jgi:hypothetical protein
MELLLLTLFAHVRVITTVINTIYQDGGAFTTFRALLAGEYLILQHNQKSPILW